MIKLITITGNKGSGKTKVLIDMANKAAKTTKGRVVCIEKGTKLTYELDHNIKLITADEYALKGYDAFFGFISGILAADYDVTEIYIDGILKIGEKDLVGLGNLFDRLTSLINADVILVFTVSANVSELPEAVKKYL